MRVFYVLLFVFCLSPYARADGAIAYGINNARLFVGISSGQPNQRDADFRAVLSCRTRAGTLCFIAGNFQDTCAAVAHVDGRPISWRVGFGSTPTKAQLSALGGCEQLEKDHPAQRCVVIAHDCDGSTAPPIQLPQRVVEYKQTPTPPSCALTASAQLNRRFWDLNWTSSYGETATLDGQLVDRIGTKSVSVPSYQTFKLVVNGSGGSVECTTFIHPFRQISIGLVWDNIVELLRGWVGLSTPSNPGNGWIPGDVFWWANFYWYAIFIVLPLLAASVAILLFMLFRQRKKVRVARGLSELDRERRAAQIDGHAPPPQPSPPPSPPKVDPAEALRRKVAASLGEAPDGGNPRQGKVTSTNTFEI